MQNISTFTMSLRITMHIILYKIVSFFILASLFFLASCNKKLKAPEPQPFEMGILSASKSEVVLDAANNPNMEAITFSWGGYKNSLINYTLILTSGGKSDSVTQNTVSRLFSNSELNDILLDKLGLKIGVTVEVKAQLRATITTNGKTAESNVITIKVTPSLASFNLVQGGKFNAGDESKWTVLTIWTPTPGVTLNFTGGKAVWKGGNWGHMGIYQAIQVEANKKYQVNMNISGSGAFDSWFQVYVGATVPQQGQEYTDGGSILGLNTWNGCGKTAFDEKLTAVSCDGKNGGVVQFPTSGTVYLVIRGGGTDLGTTGISVDNIEFLPL
jgi:hypothetical protein